MAASLRKSEHFLSVLKNHGIEEAEISAESSGQSPSQSDKAVPDSDQERQISYLRK
jgi:hypothetical protein